MKTMTAKRRPKIGDIVYEVEWCTEIALNECGDMDIDNCKRQTKSFATLEEAKRFAEAIYPKTIGTFGIVEVDLLEFVSWDDAEFPWLGSWQSTGSEFEWPKIFSGEWEN